MQTPHSFGWGGALDASGCVSGFDELRAGWGGALDASGCEPDTSGFDELRAVGRRITPHAERAVLNASGAYPRKPKAMNRRSNRVSKVYFTLRYLFFWKRGGGVVRQES